MTKELTYTPHGSTARPGDEIAPTRYRKKPVEIEAIRWSGTNLKEVIDFTGLHQSADKWTWEEYRAVVAEKGLKIFSLEGSNFIVTNGDYIIKGVKGEFYACKPDIFWMTYQRSDTPASETHAIEFAWLIENTEDQHYWTGVVWSADAFKAARFIGQFEAQETARTLFGRDGGYLPPQYKAVEHSFYKNAAPQVPNRTTARTREETAAENVASTGPQEPLAGNPTDRGGPLAPGGAAPVQPHDKVSDTPRTDEWVRLFNSNEPSAPSAADFARQLELELVQAMQALNAAGEAIEHLESLTTSATTARLTEQEYKDCRDMFCGMADLIGPAGEQMFDILLKRLKIAPPDRGDVHGND